MAHYKIQDARADYINLAMEGSLGLAEIHLQDDKGESFYLTLTEAEGCPMFFKTEKSTFDKQSEYDNDDEFYEELQEHAVAEYVSYDEVFEDSENEWFTVFRYLIFALQGAEESEAFVKESIGKFVDEIDIPKSEAEEDWEAENEG